jgi:hypothetical protein
VRYGTRFTLVTSKLVRSGLVVVALGALGLATASSSAAATPQSPSTAASSVTLQKVDASARTSAAAKHSSVTLRYVGDRAATSDASPDTITCKATVEYAHRSSTAPNLPNVHGRITCTSAIPKITVQISIYRDGTKRATGSSKSQSNGTYKDNYATAPSCVTGIYHGELNGSIVAPEGYAPQTDTLFSRGSDQSIDCGHCSVVNAETHKPEKILAGSVKRKC